MSKTERGKEEKKHTDTHTHNKDGSFSPIGLFLGQKKKNELSFERGEPLPSSLLQNLCSGALRDGECFLFFFFSTVNEKKEKSVFKLYFTFFFFVTVTSTTIALQWALRCCCEKK